MENKMRIGMRNGAFLALLVILSQPFQPTQGLIPELANFLTSIPLWIAVMILPPASTALLEGGVILAYFIVIGAFVGLAFERKAIWGWFLLIALALHHYVAYGQMARPMGEVVQSVLNLLG
ncbi:MAG: hypothetical protein HYS55_05690 [Candidatus Omnitrophica bacterium]|nr:hypothetical protein [Candidatus Omnitrophota bacterium]